MTFSLGFTRRSHPTPKRDFQSPRCALSQAEEGPFNDEVGGADVYVLH
jgi:hypothetical protein